MRHRPQSLVAVLILTAVSLLALAVTGLMEWVSAVLFLVMEFLVEFLRPLLGPRRPRRRPALIASGLRLPRLERAHRGPARRRGRLRRPAPRARKPCPGVSPP